MASNPEEDEEESAVVALSPSDLLPAFGSVTVGQTELRANLMFSLSLLQYVLSYVHFSFRCSTTPATHPW